MELERVGTATMGVYSRSTEEKQTVASEGDKVMRTGLAVGGA